MSTPKNKKLKKRGKKKRKREQIRKKKANKKKDGKKKTSIVTKFVSFSNFTKKESPKKSQRGCI